MSKFTKYSLGSKRFVCVPAFLPGSKAKCDLKITSEDAPLSDYEYRTEVECENECKRFTLSKDLQTSILKNLSIKDLRTNVLPTSRAAILDPFLQRQLDDASFIKKTFMELPLRNLNSEDAKEIDELKELCIYFKNRRGILFADDISKFMVNYIISTRNKARYDDGSTQYMAIECLLKSGWPMSSYDRIRLIINRRVGGNFLKDDINLPLLLSDINPRYIPWVLILITMFQSNPRGVLLESLMKYPITIKTVNDKLSMEIIYKYIIDIIQEGGYFLPNVYLILKFLDDKHVRLDLDTDHIYRTNFLGTIIDYFNFFNIQYDPRNISADGFDNTYNMSTVPFPWGLDKLTVMEEGEELPPTDPFGENIITPEQDILLAEIFKLLLKQPFMNVDLSNIPQTYKVILDYLSKEK